MTEKTSAPRVAQRDDTPASRAPAVADASARPPAPDNRLGAQLMAAKGAADDDFLGPL